MKTPSLQKKILITRLKPSSNSENAVPKASLSLKNKTCTGVEIKKDLLQHFNTVDHKELTVHSSPDIDKQQYLNFKNLTNNQNLNQKFVSSDESIEEVDYEEAGNNSSQEESLGVEEFANKRSDFFNDFYTNSIGEASNSIIFGGMGLINNFPKPFVKQSDRFDKKEEDSASDIKDIEKKSFSKSPTNHESNLSKRQSQRNETSGNRKMSRETYCRKLIQYSKKGDKENFLKYLEKVLNNDQADINFADESGMTALHYAVSEGNLKIATILIKTNCEVNCYNYDKKTPLHLAAINGFFDISKVLVENGASIALMDSEKNNSLHICAKAGHLELLKFLLEKHPQADCKNIYGKTPLDLATNIKVKALIQEYLNDNNNKYHKVKIHKTNNKSVNNLIMNFSQNNTKENSKNLSTKKMGLEDKAMHIKYQSNDFKVSPTKKFENTKSQPKLKQMMTQATFNNNGSMNTTGNFNNNINININIKDNIIFEKNQNVEKLQNLINCNITSSTKNLKKINVTEKFPKADISSDDYGSVSQEDSKSPSHTSSNDEEKISPASFICHTLLGKGSFGEVYLVEKKNSKTLYAMKVLSKDKIMAQNLVRYAMTERNVLSVTNHPFIVKLNYAFQSIDKLFLILDYCPCGDLAEHLLKEKRFTEERAKIYLCEIILALEDLHKRDIIFRDLKPDNVVLDIEGHALLTDFGLSKEGVLDNKGAKSFCGSIAYLAPEMLKRTGHGKSVDWYLLGVLFYEMLVGIPPYFTNNKEQIFKNIEKGELQVPKFVSDEAFSLLKALLNKDAHARLGASKHDAMEVKNHSYFNDVNWNDVYEKKLKPPVPQVKPINFGNFNKLKLFEENNNQTQNKFDLRFEHFEGWSFVNNTEGF